MCNSLRFKRLRPIKLLCPWNWTARVLEWVAISFSRESSWPGDWTQVSCSASRCFTHWSTREAHLIHWKFNFWTKALQGLKSRMSLCVFLGRVDAASIQVSQWKWRHTPIPGSQKHVSLQFQSCVNSFLGHSVQSVNVDFSAYFYPEQLKLYCQRTFPQKKARSVILPENTSTWWNLLSWRRGKCTSVVFCQVGDCKYSSFVRGKGCFLFRLRVLGSVRCFSHSFRARERHSQNTLYHSLRKEFREECSVSPSAIPLATLSGPKDPVQWLCSINMQVPMFSENADTLAKLRSSGREKWTHVCFFQAKDRKHPAVTRRNAASAIRLQIPF